MYGRPPAHPSSTRPLTPAATQIQSFSIAGKNILSGVEGRARPGEVLAVFGPSGSGKTTLLTLLAGRMEGGTVEGTVLYDGEPLNRETARLVGFCPQSDAALVPSLTVEETFRFAAELTLPESAPESFRRARIDDTVEQLGLGRVRHSRVGGVFQRGLSGGEKRRVTLGTQLIKRPRVLYLDEPTSGLDSFTAAKVMADVRRLARRLDITVMVTLHQPNPHVMESVDRVLLLVHGRLAVLGTQEECASRVREAGRDVLEHENIADVLLDFCNPDFDSKALGRVDTLRELTRRAEAEQGGGGAGGARRQARTASTAVVPGAEAWTSDTHQFRTLMWRFNLMTRRDPLIFWVRFCMIQFMAFVIGSLYFQLDDSYDSAADLVGCYFFATLVTTFVSLTALPHCASEKHILRHEYTGRLYHLRSYVAALVSSRVLVLLAIDCVFVVAVYYLVGVGASSAGQFCFFLTMLLAANLFAELLMLCVGALLRDPIAGIAVSVTVYGFFMCMSGVFITPGRMRAVYMRPVTYLSYYKYVLEGLMHNSFPHLSFRCPDVLRTLVPDFERCRVSGSDVLEDTYHSGGPYFTPDKWTCLGVICGLVLAVLGVYYRILRAMLDRRTVTKAGDGAEGKQ